MEKPRPQNLVDDHHAQRDCCIEGVPRHPVTSAEAAKAEHPTGGHSSPECLGGRTMGPNNLPVDETPGEQTESEHNADGDPRFRLDNEDTRPRAEFVYVKEDPQAYARTHAFRDAGQCTKKTFAPTANNDVDNGQGHTIPREGKKVLGPRPPVRVVARRRASDDLVQDLIAVPVPGPDELRDAERGQESDRETCRKPQRPTRQRGH
mmetsp:Transcript_26991/g.89576  ORF Transcript_26991/g.89576 Transcript_26991/m.89576 type:complete len:206 (+) Transcript_26991:656-1273(+)